MGAIHFTNYSFQCWWNQPKWDITTGFSLDNITWSKIYGPIYGVYMCISLRLINASVKVICAAKRENIPSDMCAQQGCKMSPCGQQSLWPDCSDKQSGQRVCCPHGDILHPWLSKCTSEDTDQTVQILAGFTFEGMFSDVAELALVLFPSHSRDHRMCLLWLQLWYTDWP